MTVKVVEALSLPESVAVMVWAPPELFGTVKVAVQVPLEATVWVVMVRLPAVVHGHVARRHRLAGGVAGAGEGPPVVPTVPLVGATDRCGVTVKVADAREASTCDPDRIRAQRRSAGRL